MHFIEFADIFITIVENGILAVVLSDDEIQALFEEVEANEGRTDSRSS